MNILEYSKGVERLVDPMKVGKVHYLQTKLKRLPIFWQKKIITNATKKASKMPFVVEPYCTFLFYEIGEPAKIQKFLPDNFVPAKSAIFDNGPEKYYGIVSMFCVHTSVFWGARTEFYLIAENTNTHQLSWIIMDYISDTISYDEKHGLKSPDAPRTVMTTTCEGDFICDMTTLDHKKFIHCELNLENAKIKPLNKRLWIEGNTSIAYGRHVNSESADGDLFSLTFFPEEMERALDIPLDQVRVADALCGKTGKIGAVLDRAVSFPYAQHMLSDSPGQRTHYGNEAKLRAAAEAIDFSKTNDIL